MKSSAFVKGFAAVCVATASVASAQTTNAIQLFPAANVRDSTQGTGYGANENVFNTTILNLNCTLPIQAKISSSPDGTGNVLVDNFITFNTVQGSPSDICLNGTVEHGDQQNCFTTGYSSKASNGGLNGQDPDLFVTTGGVPAIDVSSFLTEGPVQASIGLVDTGGELTSSTLYLVTSCTSQGVAGPGQVTGNPISSSNPTGAQLTQNFSFNTTSDQQVQFGYDLSQSHQNGNLSITDGTVPSTGDTPLDPTTFSSTYLHDTSFATANCLLHTGELYNGQPACKLFTLTCQVGTNPSQKGTLCPVSSQSDEIFQEVFDGPGFSLPDITTPNGPTFHQGIGFLETADSWTGGPCVFETSSSLAHTDCPQNILTGFSGPGVYKAGGHGQSPNSSFITVAPVPEDLTTVTVTGQQPGSWINSRGATVNFVTTPPSVSSPNNFVASPIQNLTYGVTTAPLPGSTIVADTLLANQVACPAPGSGNASATVFTPGPQVVNFPQDGQYLIHYFAQDCAGTQELKFTQTDGVWATSLYTFPVNVDTVFPVVAAGPVLSPALPSGGTYTVGENVQATYACTDDRSGIVQCGAFKYSTGTLSTGTLSSTVDTSKAGPGTFTVNAVDAAGNTTTKSVSYQVVAAAPVNIVLLKLAPLLVKSKAQMTYVITAANFSKQAASSVVITDPLPAGVTFVKASAQQLTCTKGKCSNTASCSFAGNTVSCTTPSLSLATPVLVEIVVQVQAAAKTKIKNTATVTSANPDSAPANNVSSATTVVF
jgi:uncharacterized repeat protein (TIGR01451 family)